MQKATAFNVPKPGNRTLRDQLAPIAPHTGQKSPNRAPIVQRVDKTVEYHSVLALTDVRPLTLFKSHSDPISLESTELLSLIAPGGYLEGQDIHEVLLLISKETTKGQDLDKLDKVQAEVQDRAQVRERVYNALAYHVRNTPEAFYSDNRPVIIPYGDPRTTMLLGYMLEGIFSERVRILNLITVGGRRVPNPIEPLIDLDKAYYAGRKLRFLRDQASQGLVTSVREL